MHEVLVNRLGGLSLPRKSVVRLTDRPDMTLDVYRGRKTTMQLSYPGFRLDQLGSKLEDIAITTIILCPSCQQPFLIKMAGDNQLSAATSKFLLLLLNLLPT